MASPLSEDEEETISAAVLYSIDSSSSESNNNIQNNTNGNNNNTNHHHLKLGGSEESLFNSRMSSGSELMVLDEFYSRSPSPSRDDQQSTSSSSEKRVGRRFSDEEFSKLLEWNNNNNGAKKNQTTTVVSISDDAAEEIEELHVLTTTTSSSTIKKREEIDEEEEQVAHQSNKASTSGLQQQEEKKKKSSASSVASSQGATASSSSSNPWNPLLMKSKTRIARAASLVLAKNDAEKIASKKQDVSHLFGSYSTYREWDTYFQWSATQWTHHVAVLTAAIPACLLNLMAVEKRTAPFQEELLGAVLWADLVGYSKLSELMDSTSNPTMSTRRQHSGSKGADAGAEAVSDILNTFFGLLMDSFAKHGGDVINVAGDGLLVFWEAKDASELAEVTQAAAHASSCVLKEFSCYEDSVLGCKMSIHAGLSCGRIGMAVVGGDLGRWNFVAHGKVVEDATMCSVLDRTGSLVVSSEARMLLDIETQAQELAMPDGRPAWLINSLPPVKSRSLPKIQVMWDSETEKTLTGLLNSAVAYHLASAATAVLADMRWLSVMFVKIAPRKTPETMEEGFQQLQVAAHRLQHIIHRYEGSIKEFGVDDKGTVLVAGFGAPVVSHPDDPVRAALAAIDVRTELSSLFDIQIGVTTGTAFCGEIGGNVRRVYAYVGSVVNLAARLMMAAPSFQCDILVDESTRELAKDRVAFASLTPIAVKGRTEKVPIFYPISTAVAKDQSQKLRASGVELLNAAVVEMIAPTIRTGSKGLAIIFEGPPGLGKTKILTEVYFLTKQLGGMTVTGKLGKVWSEQDELKIFETAIATLIGLNATAVARTAQTTSSAKIGDSEEWHRAQALADAQLKHEQTARQHVWTFLVSKLGHCNLRHAQLLMRLLGHRICDPGMTPLPEREINHDTFCTNNSLVEEIGDLLGMISRRLRVVYLFDNAQHMSLTSWLVVMRIASKGGVACIAVRPEFQTDAMKSNFLLIREQATLCNGRGECVRPHPAMWRFPFDDAVELSHPVRLFLIPLDPLDFKAVGHMLASIQHCKATHPDVSYFLTERTRGNPMFVRDWFKALQQAGCVTTTEEEDDTICFVEGVDYGLHPQPPASLVAGVIARSKQLALFPQLILQSASLMGKAIDPLLLVQIAPFQHVGWETLSLNRKLSLLCQALDTLTRAGLLEAFPHPLADSEVNPLRTHPMGGKRPALSKWNSFTSSSHQGGGGGGSLLSQTRSFCMQLLLEGSTSAATASMCNNSVAPAKLQMYRFDYLLLQDVVYNMTPNNERQRMHSKLAALYQEMVFGTKELRDNQIKEFVLNGLKDLSLAPVLINHWWMAGEHRSATVLQRYLPRGLIERYCASEVCSVFNTTISERKYDKNWFAVHIPLVPWLRGTHSCAMVSASGVRIFSSAGKTLMTSFRFRRMSSFSESIVESCKAEEGSGAQDRNSIGEHSHRSSFSSSFATRRDSMDTVPADSSQFSDILSIRSSVTSTNSQQDILDDAGAAAAGGGGGGIDSSPLVRGRFAGRINGGIPITISIAAANSPYDDANAAAAAAAASASASANNENGDLPKSQGSTPVSTGSTGSSTNSKTNKNSSPTLLFAALNSGQMPPDLASSLEVLTSGGSTGGFLGGQRRSLRMDTEWNENTGVNIGSLSGTIIGAGAAGGGGGGAAEDNSIAYALSASSGSVILNRNSGEFGSIRRSFSRESQQSSSGDGGASDSAATGNGSPYPSSEQQQQQQQNSGSSQKSHGSSFFGGFRRSPLSNSNPNGSSSSGSGNSPGIPPLPTPPNTSNSDSPSLKSSFPAPLRFVPPALRSRSKSFAPNSYPSTPEPPTSSAASRLRSPSDCGDRSPPGPNISSVPSSPQTSTSGTPPLFPETPLSRTKSSPLAAMRFKFENWLTGTGPGTLGGGASPAPPAAAVTAVVGNGSKGKGGSGSNSVTSSPFPSSSSSGPPPYFEAGSRNSTP